MSVDLKNSMCSGCTACVAVCPVNAITMENNFMGFKVPVVSEKKCINCGVCKKVCQCFTMNSNQNTNFQVRCFGVQNRNNEQRMKSQSGGLFSALAETILKANGVCYGAGINNSHDVCQMRISDKDDLHLLQGSKYVQSDVGDTLKNVYEDLASGKSVLYSGTSCMIDGLLNYLKIKKMPTDNLITCDLICHGVPSPAMVRDNLHRLEMQHGQKLKRINFRDKEFGWRGPVVETYVFEDGKKISEANYTDLFYSNVALRECCYSCQYIDVKKKPADITMADFWGIENSGLPFCDDNTGISAAIVRTQKGLELFQASNIEAYDTDLQKITKTNMNKPAKCPAYRDKFWEDYKNKGFDYCLKKYTIYGGLFFRLKRKLFKMIGKW